MINKQDTKTQAFIDTWIRFYDLGHFFDINKSKFKKDFRAYYKKRVKELTNEKCEVAICES